MSLKFIPTKGMPATDNFAKRMFQDITEIDGSSVAQLPKELKLFFFLRKKFTTESFILHRRRNHPENPVL